MQQHSIIFAALFLFCFFIQSQHASAQSDTRDHYIAAVVEFATEYDERDNAINIIEVNLNKYLDHIKEAKLQNADIIVFPECALTSIHLPTDVIDARKFTSIIPDPKEKIVPCTMPGVQSWSKSLTRLSCQAKESGIYIVVNLPERSPIPEKNDEFLLYNTNVVFDRNGTIIARYRKYNLFNEPAFNVTEKPELVTFDTDFGVTFGTFICFDILFAEPALRLIQEKKVTDIVYPTAWFSELPFLSALQVQAGWARANKVNLLAAGYNDPKFFSGGSGIYSGSQGIVDYYVPVTKNSHLLVGRVNKTKAGSHNDVVKPAYNPTHRSADYLHTMQENFANYTTEVLKENVTDKKVCRDSFCCKFSATFKSHGDVTYMMAVYQGQRLFGVEWNAVEICGIVACANTTKESCGLQIVQTAGNSEFSALSVKGDFSKDDTFVQFPSAVLYGLSPMSYAKYSYKSEPQRCNRAIEMQTNQPVSNIMGFGIYGIKKNGAISNVPLLLLVSVATFFVLWNKSTI